MTPTHRILLVEDDQALSDVLKDKLIESGYDVLIAKNGEEGLALALSEHPDLILADIIMPETDGLEMLDALRRDEWGQGALVIVLSNIQSMNEISSAVSHNVNGYFIKADWKIEDIITEIGVLLQRQTAAPLS